MSTTKKIEDLAEQTILGDNDLMFMSKSNGAGYDSKKVTLASIANYVRSTLGSTGGNNSGTGYEMLDLSEDTDGSYSSIEEYANSSNHYAWRLQVLPENSPLVKQVTKDCVVYILGGSADEYDSDSNSGWNVYINDVKIWTFGLRRYGYNASFPRIIYVKSGQTLRVESFSDDTFVSVIPLRCGGNFFIDTSYEVEEGEFTQVAPEASYIKEYVYRAERPTIFAHLGASAYERNNPTINNKPVRPWVVPNYAHNAYFILNAGDELRALSTPTGGSDRGIWKAYALLEDGSGSMGHIDAPGGETCNLAAGDTLTRQVSQDSIVRIYGNDMLSANDWDSTSYFTVSIDNNQVWTSCMITRDDDNNNCRELYLKQGQTLTVTDTYYPLTITITPLTSPTGDEYFIDTTNASDS